MIDLILTINSYPVHFYSKGREEWLVIAPQDDLSDFAYVKVLSTAQGMWASLWALWGLFHYRFKTDPGALSIVECESIIDSFRILKDQTYFLLNESTLDYGKRIERRLELLRRRETNGRSNRNRSGYVYLIKSPTGAYKIGRTNNPENRMRTFNVKLPFEIEFIALIKTEDMVWLEKDLHDRFAAKRINGEWFSLDENDVDYITGLASKNVV